MKIRRILIFDHFVDFLSLLNVCNSISNSDNEEMASNNNPNDKEIYDGTLKNIHILKQKIHNYF